MDTRDMIYFIRIAEVKSISKAAESLFISQQALSKALARMEEELGVTLFIRTREGVSLTEYGTQFLSFALSSLKRYDTFHNQLGKLKRSEDDTVYFSYASGLLMQLRPSFLPDFMASHPDTKFFMQSHNDDKYNRAKLQDDYSVVLSSLELDPDKYETVYAIESRLTLLMSKNNPLAALDTVSWSDIRTVPFIHISVENKLAAYIDSLLKLNNITPQYIINPMELRLLEYICTERNGVTIYGSNKTQCPDWGVIKSFDSKGFTMGLYVSVRKGISLTHAEHDLVDCLKKELRANFG